MSVQIEISVEYHHHQLDFRVPAEVTLARLTELLKRLFLESQVVLPSEWQLEIKDKSFRMGELDTMTTFPLGDGDVFCIVPLH